MEEREFTSLLISLYRDRPELWKVKSKDYLNRDKKSLAIKSIANVLKAYRPNFDEETLRKKINVLRTNFNKEYQKINQSKRSGASTDDVPDTTLWYYNDLLFIKDQLEIAESESTEQTQTTGTPHQSGSQASTPKKKKKSTPDSTQALTDLAIAYFKKPDLECDILAKGWALKLSRVTLEQRRYAEKIINDTIFEAEMGTLTRSGVRFLTSLESPMAHSISPGPSLSPIHSMSTAQSLSPAPSLSSAPFSSPGSTRPQPLPDLNVSPQAEQPVRIYIPRTQLRYPISQPRNMSPKPNIPTAAEMYKHFFSNKH